MWWRWVVSGALLIVAGGVWALQGFGVLPGSVMSGSLTWAIIGPIVALIGVALVIYGVRRRGAPVA